MLARRVAPRLTLKTTPSGSVIVTSMKSPATWYAASEQEDAAET
jgi:hypothetical protein